MGLPGSLPVRDGGRVVVANNYPQQLPGRVIVGATTTPTTTRTTTPSAMEIRGRQCEFRVGFLGSCENIKFKSIN